MEKELEGHADPIHRELESDIAAIHKGLVRAKVPGIPKDLPSQVRAKTASPRKPAARPARRR